MTAKALRKLMKKVRGEQADIQSAGKKRGLWANIGMGLGGLLAVGLTGGAASPLVAGLMVAGGTYIGGKLGDIAARQSKLGGSGRIKGGRFFQGERESLISQLGEKITSGALSSGLQAGFTQFKALGGLKKDGGLKKIFQKGPGGQTEGFGKLFDLKGSAIGEGITDLKGKMAMRKIAPKAYKADPSLLAEDLLTYADDPKELKRVTKLGKKAGFSSEDIDRFSKNYDPWSESIQNPTVVGKFGEDELYDWSGDIGALGEQIETYDIKQAKSAEISEVLGRKGEGYQFGPDSPKNLTKGYFSEDELYDWSGDIEDIGSRSSAYDIQQSQRIAMEELYPEDKQQFSWLDKLKGNISTMKFNVEQGLIEGEKYNQEVPWDQQVVRKEKDISAEQTSGPPTPSWLPSFAGGGDFITNGPRKILVGDNPSGRERVTIRPLEESLASSLMRRNRR